MSVRTPNIAIRGIRGKGIPSNFLIGRIAKGVGPPQLLDLTALRGFGVGGANEAIAASKVAGFGFFVEGRPTDAQFIGQGVWSKDITFHGADPDDVVTAISVATGTPAFLMKSAALITLGAITFTTPGLGVVSWVTDPYTHPAGTPMLLYAPTPQDATLGSVTGKVIGYTP